jgi:hypothetical protein
MFCTVRRVAGTIRETCAKVQGGIGIGGIIAISWGWIGGCNDIIGAGRQGIDLITGREGSAVAYGIRPGIGLLVLTVPRIGVIANSLAVHKEVS